MVLKQQAIIAECKYRLYFHTFKPSKPSGHYMYRQFGGHYVYRQFGGHYVYRQFGGHYMYRQFGGHYMYCQFGGHYMYRQFGGHYMYRQFGGHYMYRQFNFQQLYVLPTQCIYVFCVDLRTNSDHSYIRPLCYLHFLSLYAMPQAQAM
jgi:hypothetical protein